MYISVELLLKMGTIHTLGKCDFSNFFWMICSQALCFCIYGGYYSIIACDLGGLVTADVELVFEELPSVLLVQFVMGDSLLIRCSCKTKSIWIYPYKERKCFRLTTSYVGLILMPKPIMPMRSRELASLNVFYHFF